MPETAVERAMKRLASAADGRADSAAIDAALERARGQIEALAEATASLESALPQRIGEAVEQGLRAEVLPVARHFAEVRGLMGQAIRRLERLEGELLAERNARVDDLALLVDLIASGWKGVDDRLVQLERHVGTSNGAASHRFADASLSRSTDED